MKVFGQVQKAQLELCTEATKPSATDMAFQVVFTTDTFKIYVSNGTNWIDINAGTTVPTGMSLPFFGSHLATPSGYLLCDGSAVSRTTYAGLFAVIGIFNGSGDGSTTFNLPEGRGRTFRGVDLGAGLDPDAASRTAGNTGGNTGDAVGSVQLDAVQGHSHIPYGGDNISPGNNAWRSTSSAKSLQSWETGGVVTDPAGTFGTARVAAESRMKNIYVNWVIKT